MPTLLIKEEMDAIDSGNESDHDLIPTEMLENILTEVSLIQTLIEDNPVLKYSIILGKDNWNGRDCLKLLETWVNVYTRYLRLL